MIPFFFLCRDSVARPKIADFLRALKTKSHPDLPIGTAGFCWGGKWVTELCWDAEMNRTKDGERTTCCGFTAHPSRLAYPGDVEKVRLPYSVAAAEIDFMMSSVSVEKGQGAGACARWRPANGDNRTMRSRRRRSSLRRPRRGMWKG